jgi:hypothetical protein
MGLLKWTNKALKLDWEVYDLNILTKESIYFLMVN